MIYFSDQKFVLILSTTILSEFPDGVDLVSPITSILIAVAFKSYSFEIVMSFKLSLFPPIEESFDEIKPDERFESDELNQKLFKDLKSFDVKFISEVKYTLEKHFIKIIQVENALFPLLSAIFPRRCG